MPGCSLPKLTSAVGLNRKRKPTFSACGGFGGKNVWNLYYGIDEITNFIEPM
jgi:hypothetical protein